MKKYIRPLYTIIIVLVSYIVVTAATELLHELGHVIAALAIGVPFSEITFIWHGSGLGITIPRGNDYSTYVHYAGGIITGVILVFSYVFWLVCRPSPGNKQYTRTSWWVWGFVFVWGIYQFYNGYIEGAHFEEYTAEKINLNVPWLVIMVVSFALHIGLTYLVKASKQAR